MPGPYVITTTKSRPFDPASKFWDSPVRARVAVATLDEARRVVRLAVNRADFPNDIGGSNARINLANRTYGVPESGGSITLPGGTTITVEPRMYMALGREANLHEHTIDALSRGDEGRAEILAAWNAVHGTQSGAVL